MLDWIADFFSNYLSGIAVTITGVLVAALMKLLASWQRRRRAKSRISNQRPTFVLPKRRQVATYATRVPVSKAERQDALEFLQNELAALHEHYVSINELFDQQHKRLSRLGTAFTVVSLALIGIAVFANVSRMQSLGNVITVVQYLLSGLWVVVAVTLYVRLRHQAERDIRSQVEMQAQVKAAVGTVMHGQVVTYSQLGELAVKVDHSLYGELARIVSEWGTAITETDVAIAASLHQSPVAEPAALLVKNIRQRLESTGDNLFPSSENLDEVIVTLLRNYPLMSSSKTD